MKTLKLAAVAALAIAGLAGTAEAKLINPSIDAKKLSFHFCHPHYERTVIHLHGNKDLVLVYYVNRFCQKKLVYRYVRFHFHGGLLAKKSG